MQALRTRAACVARRTRTTTTNSPTSSRTYASESHGHAADSHAHHAPPPAVEEGLGPAFYIFAGAVPAAIVAYQITRPGTDGEPSALSKWLSSFQYFDDWERRNAIRTAMIEQAAHDRHLFQYAGRNMHVELKTPELIYSGSQISVPAGHYPNLDHLTEHYRQKFHKEEERKLKKLVAKKEAAAAAEAPSSSSS
ncbi:hypothetical protein F4778DRAFT_736522 [Xylariomycetidae sp. FL2044]|nr:hypothetical protein F4778DRAFT_736522 [Xylariomycetidae sp. FL2044]